MSEIRERPILMCGSMVVATLEGRKTQTRRVMNQPELIYVLTDERLSVIHNKHENKTWGEVEANTNFPERRLYGGRGWQDLFEDQVCGLWGKGLRGLVCVSRVHGKQGLFDGVVVPPEQKSDKDCSAFGLHGFPRHATKGQAAGKTLGRPQNKQCAEQPEMGKPVRAMAGRACSWYFSRRRTPLGVQILQRGKAIFAVGHPEGALFPASRGTNAEDYPIFRLCNSPWQVGGLAWVRETACFQLCDKKKEKVLAYRADGVELPDSHAWTPSIFMPRWASRLTLEITSVSVERLQDITPEDATAEGLLSDEFPIGGRPVVKYGLPGWQHQWFRQSPVDAYERIWESINGPGSWALNPWVWAITFRKL